MRTIKFRVWQKEQKKFYYFSLFDVLGFSKRSLGSPSVFDEKGISYPVRIIKDIETINDYTNKKDLRGVEIYEDDIVRVRMERSYLNGIYLIKYSEKYAMWCYFQITDKMEIIEPLVKRSDAGPYLIKTTSTEIIGNFYQNPDSLPK